MHIDPDVIVCDCGQHVSCTADWQVGTFRCQNPKCPQYRKLMRAAVEVQPVVQPVETKPANAAPLSTEYLDKH